jgi:maltokinase
MGNHGGKPASDLSTVASAPLPGGSHVLRSTDEPGDPSFHQYFPDSLAEACAEVLAGGRKLGVGKLTHPLPAGLHLRAEQHTPHATTLLLADDGDTDCYALTLPRRVWPGSATGEEPLSTLIGRYAPELVGRLQTRIQRRDYTLGSVHRLPCVPNAYEMTRDHAEAQYFSHAHKILLGQTVRYLHDSLLMAFPYEWVPADEIRRELEERLDAHLTRAPGLAQHEDWIRDCYRRLTGEMLVQRIHGTIHYERIWLNDDHWVIGGWEERHRPDSPLRDLAAIFRGIFWGCSDNPTWCEKAIDSVFEGYGEPLLTLPFSLFVLDTVCGEIAGLTPPPEGSQSDPLEFLVWFRGTLMANLDRMEQSAFQRG